MPVIFSRLPGICTKVLGEDVVWVPTVGSPVPLRGIFDDTFAVANVFEDGPGIAGSQPRLHLKSVDAIGILRGAALLIRGLPYKVTGEPVPDGMGMTVFMLQRG